MAHARKGGAHWGCLGSILGCISMADARNGRAHSVRPGALLLCFALLLSGVVPQGGDGLRQALLGMAIEEKCIVQALPSVAGSCTALPAYVNSSTQGPRDELIRLLQNCISGSSAALTSQRPMSLFGPVSNLGNQIRPFTRSYTQLTSIPIQVDTVLLPDYPSAILADINKAASNGTAHDSWMVLSSMIAGDGAGRGVFKNLTSLVAQDKRVSWSTLLPVLRTTGLLYASEVYGLPLNAYTYHLIYRKDIFEQYNITMPRTWRELLDFARQYNGTAGMHAFCGNWSPCYIGKTYLFMHIMSSYLQTHGYKQGTSIDPDTMEIILNNEAVREVLELLKGFYAISPSDESEARGCPIYPLRYSQGQCITTLFISLAHKFLSHRSKFGVTRRVQGRTGYAPWPGSDRVLNRTSKKLVPCTPETCPYATRYANSDGTTQLVNVSPYFDSAAWTMNARSPPDLSFFTYQVLSYLTSEQVGLQLALNPDTEVVPTRMSHLQPSLWIAAGYNANDTAEFLTSLLASLNHPNIYLPLRLPGAQKYLDAWGWMAHSVVNQSIDYVMSKGTADFVAALNRTFEGSASRMKETYWLSLNRIMPSPGPPPQPPLPHAPKEPLRTTNSGLSPGYLALSIVLPCVVLALAVGIAMRHRSFILRSRVQRGHPGSGPATTLCVTDIENSTNLWEALDELVMDTSLKLQNACIRGLAAKHGGYESVWEGDSFIIAFHHPSAAVAFCMAVQQQLLHMPWPAELLHCEHGREVWCRPRQPAKYEPETTDIDRVSYGGQFKYRMSFFGFGIAPTEPTSSPRISSAPGHESESFIARSTATTGGLGAKPSDRVSCGDVPSSRLVQRQSDKELPSRRLPPGLSEKERTTGGLPQALSEHERSSTGAIPERSTGGGLRFMSSLRMSLHGARGSTHGARTSAHSGRVHPSEGMQTMDARMEQNMGAHVSAQWQKCEANSQGAVLAWRGLRVRMGLHAALDTPTSVTFNTVMQRYHYTGPIRVISNAVTSAGHGGYTLMSTSTAALLDSDGSGVLKGLPDDAGVYYMGKHVLSGAGEPLDLLLVLSEPLRCRLALQQADLRSQAVKVPGILTAPVPSPAASDSTALAFVQFSGLSTLMAWDAEETSKAIRLASACISDVLASCQGTLSEDGLARYRQRHPAASSIGFSTKGSTDRVVIACRGYDVTWSPRHAASSPHPAVSLAIALRDALNSLHYRSEFMCHALTEHLDPAGLSFSEAAPPCASQSLKSRLSVIIAVEETDGDAGVTGQLPFLSTEGPEQAGSITGPLPRFDTGPGQACPDRYLIRGDSQISDRTDDDWESRILPHLNRVSRKGGDRASISRVRPDADRASIASIGRGRLEGDRFSLGRITARMTRNGAPADVDDIILQRLGLASTHIKTGRKATHNSKAPKYYVFESNGLHGLRFKIAVVAAQGAACAVDTRASGHVAYSGAPIKRAQKRLAQAKVGEIVADHSLMPVISPCVY